MFKFHFVHFVFSAFFSPISNEKIANLMYFCKLVLKNWEKMPPENTF